MISATTSQATEKVWQAQDMKVLLGDRARHEGKTLVLELDEQGKAIIELPAQGVSLGDHPFLALQAGPGSDLMRFMLIWRHGPRAQVQRRELPAPSPDVLLINLSEHEQWRGSANLLAIAATGEPGKTIALEMAALRSSSLGNILSSTWQYWTRFTGLRQNATNAHSGVSPGSSNWSATPYVALLLLPLCLIFLSKRVRRHKTTAYYYLLAGIFLGWLFLDALWLSLWSEQAKDTRSQYAHLPIEERLRQGEWGRIYRFVEAIKQLDEKPDDRRYFIASEDEFLRLLTHFHMLPRASYWDRGTPELPDEKYLRSGDYVVVTNPSQWRFDTQKSVLSIQGRAPIPAEEVLHDSTGAVYELQ